MKPTITAFESSPDEGQGLARDMRVRWALEEVGQPYDVRLLSLTPIVDHETATYFGRKRFSAASIWPWLRRESVTGCDPNRLGDAQWLDGEFSAADLLMVFVLRRLDGSGLVDEYPKLAAYVVWQRAARLQASICRSAGGFQQQASDGLKGEKDGLR